MQKAEKKRPVIDPNGHELSKKVIKKLPKSELSPELDKTIKRILEGKEKLSRYTFDEYIEHVDKILEE
jgi:hypothetical protein